MFMHPCLFSCAPDPLTYVKTPRHAKTKQIRRHVARVLNEETAEIDEEETAAAAVAAADVEDSDDDGFGNPFGAFAGREGMDPFAAAVATAAAVTRGRAIMPPSSNPSPANAGPIPSARLTGEHAASQFPPPPPPPLSMGMESGGLWEFEEVDMDAIDLEMLEEDPDEDVMVVETDDFVVRVCISVWVFEGLDGWMTWVPVAAPACVVLACCVWRVCVRWDGLC